ncbi:rhomboid family intramembrane serine protease [Albidovulum sp.]|uniref:rhomboid family intramembrane serine protease n=1 Tax=Albidovulum sp. TaxID=1872424 RepID=UPI0039B973AD
MSDTGSPMTLSGSFGGPVPRSVWGIVALCVLPEVILTGADWRLWGQPWWRLLTYQYAGFWPGLLGDWQPNYAAQPVAMFVSYGFLHAGPWHLAVNMVTLFLLAGPVAARIGTRGFLWAYGLSLLGGALGFAGLTAGPAPMVGASGALFGLAGAFLALEFDRRISRGLPVRNVLAMVFGLAAGNAILTWSSDGALAWQAHLGGFVAGWAYATALCLRRST